MYHWLRANTDYLQSLGNGATFKVLSKAAVSKRLAAQLDGDDLQPAAFGALVRQFRQIDQQLRALDAAAAFTAETADEDESDLDDNEAGWDPNKL